MDAGSPFVEAYIKTGRMHAFQEERGMLIRAVYIATSFILVGFCAGSMVKERGWSVAGLALIALCIIRAVSAFRLPSRDAPIEQRSAGMLMVTTPAIHARLFIGDVVCFFAVLGVYLHVTWLRQSEYSSETVAYVTGLSTALVAVLFVHLVLNVLGIRLWTKHLGTSTSLVHPYHFYSLTHGRDREEKSEEA